MQPRVYNNFLYTLDATYLSVEWHKSDYSEFHCMSDLEKEFLTPLHMKMHTAVTGECKLRQACWFAYGEQEDQHKPVFLQHSFGT